MSDKKGKVAITALGEKSITKEQKAKLGFTPICGKSFAVSEETAKFLIGKKYGIRCEIPKAVKVKKEEVKK